MLAQDRAEPLEPLTGIEPARPAWKAGVLPLNYRDVWSGGARENPADGFHALPPFG